MSDEAFLRAIQADPADAARKLVYADWLDENGRPDRAAFVRDEATGRLPRDYPERAVMSAQTGSSWHDLYMSSVHLWDAPTLLALGRLQGMLDALAAGNNHRADISYWFQAILAPLTEPVQSFAERSLSTPAVRLTPLNDWQTALRTDIARWIGMEHVPGTIGTFHRLAHQTEEGCLETAGQVIGRVAELLRPEHVWAAMPPANQSWGIDWSEYLLEGGNRVLRLSFSFDD